MATMIAPHVERYLREERAREERRAWNALTAGRTFAEGPRAANINAAVLGYEPRPWRIRRRILLATTVMAGIGLAGVGIAVLRALAAWVGS